MIVFRAVIAAISLILMLFGVIAIISPIPMGLPAFIFGMALFAAAAPAPMRLARQRWRALDKFMHRLDGKLPPWLVRRLGESDFMHEDEKDPDRPH
jgi:hypothetical protein